MAFAKPDLVSVISEERGYSKRHVKQIVDDVFATMSAALASGIPVKINEFGMFEAVSVPPTKRRNPNTGGTFTAPATYRVRFKPGSTLRRDVKGG